MARVKDFIKGIFIRFEYLLIKLFSKQANNKTRNVISTKSFLVLAPHPDDEVFGLGGFILKMLDSGSKFYIIYITDGEGSDVWHDRKEISKQRIALSENVCSNLHINKSDMFRMHIPDGFVPHPGQSGFEATVKSVKEIIDSVKPDAVFATHRLDYWPFDHVAGGQIAYEAVNKSDTKPQLWYYWVWAWYNVRPWKLSYSSLKRLQKINIRDQIIHKKELMGIYLKSVTPEGKPWCGILPKPLLRAFDFPFEIVERIS